MDLKLPITIHDELNDEVIESTGVLDLASGEIRDVKYVDFDTETGGFPAESADYDFTCVYEILESPMGVDNYVATLKLTPITDGARCFAEWSAEFDCAPSREAELTQSIGQGVFQAGFDALKRGLR